MIQYAWQWGGFIHLSSQAAFDLMVDRIGESEVNSIDILRLAGALGYTMGAKLRSPLTKAAWERLHTAVNPVYRFIALEKLDSVEQTPSELLALYRECLLGSCSYLEARALSAIMHNQDYREEVAILLEEYKASNPPENDGTLPSRKDVKSLMDGADRLIKLIRGIELPPVDERPGF